MHPTLLACLKDPELSDSAKSLLSYLYANTNGNLSGAIFIEEICADLRVAEATLRRRRAELAEAGYLASERAGDTLHFELPERTPGARPESDNAHLLREEDPEELPDRAVGARSDDHSAHLLREADSKRAPDARGDIPERAPTARSEAPNAHLVREERPQRALGARSAGNTLSKLINQEEEEELTSSSSEGGVGETNSRTAQLLRAAGITPKITAELASMLTLEAVARHIAAWQIDRDVRPELGVGALVTRLRTWDMPLELHTDDLTAGLLAGHITDQDLQHWRVKRKRKTTDGYRVPPGYEGLVMS